MLCVCVFSIISILSVIIVWTTQLVHVSAMLRIVVVEMRLQTAVNAFNRANTILSSDIALISLFTLLSGLLVTHSSIAPFTVQQMCVCVCVCVVYGQWSAITAGKYKSSQWHTSPQCSTSITISMLPAAELGSHQQDTRNSLYLSSWIDQWPLSLSWSAANLLVTRLTASAGWCLLRHTAVPV